MRDIVLDKLRDRNVTLEDIGEIVIEIQKSYVELTMDECIANIMDILNKREVQHAILTGIQLDELAEKNLLEEPLLSIIKSDDSMFGIDEMLAMSIAHIYGSIGITNFGYLDKTKPGIIGKIDKGNGHVGTFLDDIICAIVAAAASRIAHSKTKNPDI